MEDVLRILELKNISKKFAENEILKSLDFHVDEGEFVSLLGSSGCGKTTMLRIIAGLETPDSGEVFLLGDNVTNFEPNKRDVNTVFQSYALFPHMNVEENVAYSLKLKKIKKAKITKRVDEILELVQLSEYKKRMPSELSGGQRQRVAIARSLIAKPKILLLDEPLGALDAKLRREMQSELKKLQQKLGISFVYVTHDQEEALNMSDRIAVMKDGRFEQIGTASEIYDSPKTSYVAQFVGNANIIKGKALCQGEMVKISNEFGEAYVLKRNFNCSDIACLAVRSEQIQFTENGFEAVVTEKSFTGGMLRISLKMGDTTLIASRHGIDYDLKIGQRVTVGFDPQSAVLVEDNEE